MLSIDLSLIVVFLVVWILVAVLTKVFFNPLRRIMGAREDQLDQNNQAAETALESFEKESIKVEEKLREARAMAQTLRKKLMGEGQKQKESLLMKTNTDCRSQVDAAQEQLSLQIEILKKELYSQSQSLADQIERRLLG